MGRDNKDVKKTPRKRKTKNRYKDVKNTPKKQNTKKTFNVRGMTDELLRAANSSFQKNKILRMENISSIPEAIVISKYKGTIWNVRNALMRGAKHNEERTAEKSERT